MKKLFSVILLFAAVLTFAQVTHSFTSQLIDFQVTAEQTYKVVTNQQTNNFTAEEGAPMLPVFTKSFVLPAGSTVTDIAVSNQDQVLLDSGITLYPVQPAEWDSIPAFVPPASAIYNSSVPFPQETVVKSSDVTSLGYHVVTLEICPFKYIPHINT